MTIHGYTLVNEWRNSQCGQIACATKGGKKYFLKKYQTPVAPINNGTLDTKTFAHNKKLFEDFVATRHKINAAVRPIAGPGGNIIIPCDEFIEENHFVEASEFVEGVVSDEELEGVLASLSVDVKKLLMQTAAGALFSVHSKHIVHSDLKLKNVLLVRNHAGNYVAKLIDFDCSYFVHEKPEDIIGTIDYYSPELGAYVDAEDDREEKEKALTEKSDIFSLGLIFHYYLCGALPTPIALTESLKKRKEKGKVIYPWVALNSGCDLQISPEIKRAKYVSLIRDMLSLNPNDRPTAAEVLKRLREAEPVIEEPWPEHSIVLNKKALLASSVVGLKKINVGGLCQYELLYNTGKKKILTKEELLSKGFVKVEVPKGFSKPWKEHGLVFDLEKIKSRGFVAGEQATLGGVKGYNFYRPDSTVKFFNPSLLVAMGYAKKQVATPKVTPGFATPWPEHAIGFDVEAIKKKGYVRLEQAEMGGVKGYLFTRTDGSSQFIRVEMVLIQKMAGKVG